MQTIWKFPLKIEDIQVVKMPAGAEIIAMQTQYDQPCIWALVDESAPVSKERVIETFGTGHPVVQGDRKYLGTYQLSGGGLVFHVFERL